MLSLVVLISGFGSNLRALLEACDDQDFPAQVIAVGADREAAGLLYASDRGIPTFVVPYSDFSSREGWGSALLAQLTGIGADLVVLSGLMRILPPELIVALSPNLINTHPAHLPEFPGAHAVRDALAAGVAQTGATVHIVDSGVDTGPVLVQQRVAVEPEDTQDALHERIKTVERMLLIDTVRRVATGDIDLNHVRDGSEREGTP